jgi:acetylornithine/N-succinyldiaminopimelate aminotransferase
MTSELLAKRWVAVMMDNYGTPPLAVASGQGVRVTDVEGNSYLDFVAGIAVSALGHAHPAIVAAVRDQVAALAHSSNLLIHEPGVRLAERLQSLVGDPTARVFFANDGTEANECAIKLSRLYGRSVDPSGGRLRLVATNNSFHGRTMGALALTGNPAKREPFEPLPGPVSFLDYGDIPALRAAVDSSVAAVFLEPIQGEAGVVPPPPDYLKAAREICDATGALLVIDEVQSGIGRTGQWFASIAAGVVPDIMTLAKGLGGGLPIGACIGFGKAGALFTPGAHGSTFGGNPVSCAAALAVLDTIERDGLLERVRRCGSVLQGGLQALGSPLIRQVRGSGLWYGVVLSSDCAAAVEQAARERGLLVNPVRPDVLRLAPPLIVTESEIDEALQALRAALETVHADQAVPPT